LRRRVLKSSAEREQLLQQLTQRGGQKKSDEQPPFGKKFLRRKISKAEKEARVVLRLERLPTCFLSWNNQFFFTDTYVIYLLKSFFRVVRLFARRRL
jgi:hypothetical protein